MGEENNQAQNQPAPSAPSAENGTSRRGRRKNTVVGVACLILAGIVASVGTFYLMSGILLVGPIVREKATVVETGGTAGTLHAVGPLVGNPLYDKVGNPTESPCIREWRVSLKSTGVAETRYTLMTATSLQC